MTRTLGRWDCPYCSNTGILGNVFECNQCGAPRARGVRFYQLGNEPEVTPAIARQLGSGGPNWYCEHCDSGNRDTDNECWSCGAPRGSSPIHEVTDYRGSPVPRSTDEAAAVDSDGESWVSAPRKPIRDFTLRNANPASGQTSSHADPVNGKPTPRGPAEIDQPWWEDLEDLAENAVDYLDDSVNVAGIRTQRWVPIAALTGAFVLLVVLITFFFKTNTEMVRVTGYAWTQSVTVEEYMVVHEDSWGTHPSAAYNIDSSYRDTGRDRKVHDGWRTESYIDTCYETEPYTYSCTEQQYVSKSCNGRQDNGDGSFTSYTYDCGSYQSYSTTCTGTHQVPYSCTKTKQVEIYHYEDIYDWYYVFDINRWRVIATYPTSGFDHSPYFETDFALKNPFTGGSPELGQQRAHQLRGRYVVGFSTDNVKVGENGYFDREYDYAEWLKFSREGEYPIEVNAFNLILEYPKPTTTTNVKE